jgi:hypothetical protein
VSAYLLLNRIPIQIITFATFQDVTGPTQIKTKLTDHIVEASSVHPITLGAAFLIFSQVLLLELNSSGLGVDAVLEICHIPRDLTQQRAASFVATWPTLLRRRNGSWS